MKMDIKTANVIEVLIAQAHSIEVMYRTIPKGTFLTSDSKYLGVYNNCRKAEAMISAIGDVLGVSENALYAVTRTALNWYKRLNWDKCLPEEVASRLLSTMIKQYPRKGCY